MNKEQTIGGLVQREIHKEMSELNDRIELLSEKFNQTLTDRLQYIINKSTAGLVREARPEEALCSSEIGQRLQTMRNKLENLCDNIDDLVDILEI
jgi:hypothetical protein